MSCRFMSWAWSYTEKNFRVNGASFFHLFGSSQWSTSDWLRDAPTARRSLWMLPAQRCELARSQVSARVRFSGDAQLMSTPKGLQWSLVMHESLASLWPFFGIINAFREIGANVCCESALMIIVYADVWTQFGSTVASRLVLKKQRRCFKIKYFYFFRNLISATSFRAIIASH